MPPLSVESFRKLTENAGEAFLDSVIGTDAIYEIPYFQRPYKWGKHKLVEFQNDILRLLGDSEDTESHFFGAVIIQIADGTHRPTVARRYQVIDGQQRMTTTMLYLVAAVDVLLESGEEKELNLAVGLFKKYLVVTSETDGKSNFKLHSCGEDRQAMNAVMNSVYADNRMRDKLSTFRLIELETGSGPPSNRIKHNYKTAKSFMKSHYDNGGLTHLESIWVALLLGVTVVQIVINNPLSGPKIFHSLNSKQEPMTVGELVRNDVFNRQATANDGNIEDLYRDLWNPFYEAFGPPEKKLFDGYFFPFGLITLSPNVKKSAVYPELRERWTDGSLSPEEIVSELARYQADYLDLLVDGNRAGHVTELANAVARLRDFGLPTSIFSFLIRISYEVRQGNLPSTVGVKLFKSIESFLVRRGVFGLEPSGLHAAFKGMWNDLEQRRQTDQGQIEDYPRYLKESISARTTVKWPSDEEFRESIRNRSLYGSLVTPFILREYDKFLGNDGVDYSNAEIEHVLPQTPHQQWFDEFTRDQHKTLVGRLGNLTLLTPRMNKDLSNNPFELKCQEYLVESRYHMTRKLASDYGVWTPESIAERGVMFSDWAIQRWPE